MIHLEIKTFSSLSFSPDEPVLASSFDTNSRRLIIALTKAYADDKVLEGVRVEISDWTDAKILIGEQVLRLSDELSDICEFEYQGNKIRLAGFLRNAPGWYDITFLNPQLSVEYASEEKFASRLP
ncbi:hypothetical protein [Deinococcus sp.]|uniref:hypothetical protein n=1 Tax=Deinococcus sp. TaxID=47478 RepID=UPI003B5A9471